MLTRKALLVSNL